MRREFNSYFGATIQHEVDFNTIDGFQGQEKEIIIISCVRADDTKSSVGFLKDFRRMNVALTRAKTSMWILGHQKSLVKNKLWNRLITDARERGCLEFACPGFLNAKNANAQELLTRHRPSDDTSLNSDDYDPFESVKPERKVQPKRKREEGGTAQNRNESNAESKRKTNSLANSTASQGKKRKSSLFGGPNITNDISFTGPYIKDRVKSGAKKPDNLDARSSRHVGFSDDVEIIPLHDNVADANSSSDLRFVGPTEDKTAQVNPSIRNADAESEDAENDYTPEEHVPSKRMGRQNKRAGSTFENTYRAPEHNSSPGFVPQGQTYAYPKGSSPPNDYYASGGSNQQPPYQYYPPTNNFYPENSSHPQGPTQSLPLGTMPASQPQPPPAPQQLYKPAPQYNAVRSGTIGGRSSDRRQHSSNLFIPKKKQHHRY